jgi:hypothetical protein
MDYPLTSYDRMRKYIAMDSDSPSSGSDGLRRELEGWIMAVSDSIQKYLNRGLKLESRTEYFDARYMVKKYWVYAPPIVELTSVHDDYSGLWTGDESEVDDSFIGHDSKHFVLGWPLSHARPKGIRVIYVGGLAQDSVRTSFITTGDTLTAGKYVIGSNSSAKGIVRGTPTATSVDVENIYGIFNVNDILTEYNDEAGVTPTSKTATVSSIPFPSLAETYPAIVRACEAQVRFMWKHRDDFEVMGVTKDAVNLRRAELSAGLAFTKEVINLLDPYRKIIPQ